MQLMAIVINFRALRENVIDILTRANGGESPAIRRLTRALNASACVTRGRAHLKNCMTVSNTRGGTINTDREKERKKGRERKRGAQRSARAFRYCGFLLGGRDYGKEKRGNFFVAGKTVPFESY
jgi:hypothetical protein